MGGASRLPPSVNNVIRGNPLENMGGSLAERVDQELIEAAHISEVI